jgi:peptidoglycan/xylan/chitin deacetylase (PgdA/CDA1 family)
MLPTHGRYDYTAWRGRTPYAWPGGAKLAVYLGVNLEHFAFGEGLGAELAPGGPQPDVLNFAWRDYGNRVGGWRLLDLLDEVAMPATVLLNSAMYDYAPDLVAAHRARGDEMAGHGRTNSERQSVLPEAEERRLIADSTEAIVRHEGTAPRGWLSPWIAESRTTPDLLAEAGVRVTVLETRRKLGGRATSFTDPRTGEVLDNCQHVLMGCCTNLLDFYERLGVQDAAQPLPHVRPRAEVVGDDVSDAQQHVGHRRDLRVRIDEVERPRIEVDGGRIGAEDLAGQRLEPPLPGDLRERELARLEGQIEILELLGALRRADLLLERRGQLPLPLDRPQDRLLAVRELPGAAHVLGDQPDGHLVEAARLIATVAGDERNGVAVVEQAYDRLDRG